jgi:hypothetical protein
MKKQANDTNIRDNNFPATANENLLDMEDDENVDSRDSVISQQGKRLRNREGEDSEENNLHRAQLDNTDNDGDLLNEVEHETNYSGSDLDIPGSEDDDALEDIGEEDEENNGYSEADTE